MSSAESLALKSLIPFPAFFLPFMISRSFRESLLFHHHQLIQSRQLHDEAFLFFSRRPFLHVDVSFIFPIYKI